MVSRSEATGIPPTETNAPRKVYDREQGVVDQPRETQPWRLLMRLPTALLFFFVVFGAFRTLHAQTVTGRVLDSGSATPVGRGFVIALDTNGMEVARTLTGTDGTFEIRLPGPATYRLRSERIAYRPIETEPFEMHAGGTVVVDLEIQSIPVTLDAIEVEGESQCSTNPDEGARTAVLWEEIRKALDGASWTGAQGGYRYRFLQYQRELDMRARRVLNERTADRVGSYRTPFRTREAEWLSENGFVVEDQESLWFYAPDTDVLQHDAFLSTHCFRVVRDDDRENLVGLEFRPADGRDGADITGVLWLDQSTAELTTLEFGYTALPGGIDDERIGGTIDFLLLPNGAWIVRQWVIRLPVLGVDANLADQMRRSRAAVRGYQDTGGEIVTVATTRRDTVYTAPRAELVGTVVDRSNGGPLHGAEVRIVGTEYNSITNADGQFRIGAYVDGEYGVSFSHPRTDSLGYTPPEELVALARGKTASVHLALPPPQDVYASVCGVSPERGTRAVIGSVTSGERPVEGVNVNVIWQQDGEAILEALRNNSVSRLRSFGATAVTDRTGFYRACGVPTDIVLMIGAQTDSTWSRPTAVTFDSAGVWYLPTPCLDQSPNELLRAVANIGANARSNADCYGSRERLVTADLMWRQDLEITRGLAPNTVLISGIVVQPGGLSPIPQATVTIEPLGATVVTGEDGGFDIPVREQDDLVVVVAKEGYQPVRHAIGAVETRRIQLPTDVLAMQASEQERTTADRSIITREAIAETRSTTAAEVIRQLHPDWFRVRGTVGFSGNAQPVVYVNNSRWGGVDALETIRADDIAEIRHFEPRDATTRFGTGHTAGAIQVMLNR
jgi:hypothetical protein